ncbi:hypothetical protein QBC40DRAFT_252778 [Triangularia verruculosa]|uniref:Uncharacterized protein n=1 Tax=Triangularia verruculosa TaxID=2587418 RepID=A0AAN6XPT5_9PEZI|nr:hypothetical protein QBC40DRAFT_252778 [Triangularia verruculosa]
MKTKNGPSCYSLTQEMIEEYNYSAQNLLYHFCSILRGRMGFRAARDNRQEMKDREGLDEAAAQYISKALDILAKTQQPQQVSGSGLAPGDLPPPNGRWITQLFDRAD